MNVFELLNKLLECRTEEINYAILQLMIQKKLDSHRVFDLYMQAIEHERDDSHERLCESNMTIADLLINLKSPNLKKSSSTTATIVHNAIHRALYNLNVSKQFNMQRLNEKHEYDEEKDKHLSWYWRKHNE